MLAARKDEIKSINLMLVGDGGERVSTHILDWRDLELIGE